MDLICSVASFNYPYPIFQLQANSNVWTIFLSYSVVQHYYSCSIGRPHVAAFLWNHQQSCIKSWHKAVPTSLHVSLCYTWWYPPVHIKTPWSIMPTPQESISSTEAVVTACCARSVPDAGTRLSCGALVCQCHTVCAVRARAEGALRLCRARVYAWNGMVCLVV